MLQGDQWVQFVEEEGAYVLVVAALLLVRTEQQVLLYLNSAAWASCCYSTMLQFQLQVVAAAVEGVLEYFESLADFGFVTFDHLQVLHLQVLHLQALHLLLRRN